MGRAPHRQTSSRRKHNDGRCLSFVVAVLSALGFSASAAWSAQTNPPSPPLLSGRVLDERRFPVAGATVTMRTPGVAHVATTTTDADGRFGFAVPSESTAGDRDRGELFATTADGRSGWGCVFFSEAQLAGRSRVDLHEPIVLAPSGRLRVTVRDAAGEVADAAVELREEQGGTAIVAARSDVHGVATIGPAPACEFALFAKRAGRGRATVETKIASGATVQAEVQLRALRSLEVTVVDADDGSPVPGATLSVIRNASGPNPGAFPGRFRFEDFVVEPAATGADGRIELRDLEAGSEIQIRVDAKHHDLGRTGWLPRPDRPRCDGFVSADALAARIEVTRRTAHVLRYAVDPGSGPVPADGTRFEVELPREHLGCVALGAPRANEGGTLHDGVLEVALELPAGTYASPRGVKQPAYFSGWAVAADGSTAHLIPSMQGDGVARFVPSATLTVTLRDSDGRPLADRGVELAYEANRNQESSPERQCWTDSNGVARFGKLWKGRWIATAEGVARFVELEGGAVEVPLTQAKADEIVLQFTVDGARRLPSHLLYGIDGERFSERREDPAAGDVHVFVPPTRGGREWRITLHSPESGSFNVPMPPPNEDHSPVLLAVASTETKSGTLEARIRGGGQELCVQAQRLDESRREFVVDPSQAGLPLHLRDGSGWLTLRGIRPGIWRLAVADTNTISEPVTVTAGDPAARIEFDLTSVDSLPVFWAVPEGESRDFLEVGPAPSRRPSGSWREWESEWPLRPGPGRNREDGSTHRLAVDRRAPPKLDARHPYLVSSRWNDTIDLKNPRSVLTLHMELGPLLTLSPQFPEGVATTDGAFVKLVDPRAPPAAGDAADVRRALRRGDAFAMAPPAAGERRVLIDPVVAAPAELASVVFDGGPRDLGAIRFARGSTLHVHARATAPFAAPRVIARATRIDGVAYERASSMRDSAAAPCDPEIRALGPGRFRVVVGEFDGLGDSTWTAEVTVDGVHDAELTILTD